MAESVIFRKEVLESQQTAWLPPIHLNPPAVGWVFGYLSIVLILLAAALLSFGTFTKKETVSGVITSTNGLLTIAPASAGNISRIHAIEGNTVSANSPLFEISGEQSSVALGEAHRVASEQLMIKLSNLRANLDQLSKQKTLSESDIRSRIELISLEGRELDAQTDLVVARTADAKELYEKFALLAESGQVSKAQLLMQHDTYLQAEAQIKELRAKSLNLKQRQQQLKYEAANLDFTIADQKSQIERQIADVSLAISNNEVGKAILLSSPHNGTILDILVHAGQQVAPGQTLATVLPDTSKLQAELWLLPEAVGLIKLDQRVSIHYSAFPYQRFGYYGGTIVRVGKSALNPESLLLLTGQKFSESRYRVEVELDTQNVIANGRPEALKPGMTLTASILLERRPLYSWLIETLLMNSSRPSLGPQVKGKTPE